MSRINLSGRRRIPRSRIRAVGTGLPDGPEVTVDCTLGGLDLASDAAVFVEFYRRTVVVRRNAGTVGRPLVVREDFADFTDPGGVLLRVRVVDIGEAQRGRLVASAERVPIQWDDPSGEAQSLLAFRRADDMADRPWRLELGDSPTVAVNAEVRDWQAFARSEPFVALVYPEIVRQVALWVIDQPDESEIAADWARFLEDLAGATRPEPDDDPLDMEFWADQAADGFARRHRILARVRALAEVDG